MENKDIHDAIVWEEIEDALTNGNKDKLEKYLNDCYRIGSGVFLYNAVQYKLCTYAELFINNGVDVNYEDRHGHSILQIALIYKKYYIAKKLLNKGADPNFIVMGLYPLLYYIVRIGDVIATKILLDNGANPNLRDINGDTVMHVLVERYFYQTLSPGNNITTMPIIDILLLDKKLDLGAKNNKSLTPIDLLAKKIKICKNPESGKKMLPLLNKLWMHRMKSISPPVIEINNT